MDLKQRVITELNKRIAELQNILPKNVFDINDFYFAGGCIYSIWHGNEPKDYDIFCKNKKAMKKIINFFNVNKEKCNVITENAITMGNYQFVTKYIGNPDIQVSKFDFKHNMFYYDGKELVSVSGWKYIESNQLEFNSKRARDVLNIISRIPKFVERGMEITQSEIYTILECGTRPSRIFSERAAVKRHRSGRSGY